MFKKLIYRIKSKFGWEENGAVPVERDEFAHEMKEKFKGNKELLKVIEEGMNRYAKKDEYVSLLD